MIDFEPITPLWGFTNLMVSVFTGLTACAIYYAPLVLSSNNDRVILAWYPFFSWEYTEENITEIQTHTLLFP